MEEKTVYNKLVSIAATDEFKWTMFKWYMQGLHSFNYWSLNERP